MVVVMDFLPLVSFLLHILSESVSLQTHTCGHTCLCAHTPVCTHTEIHFYPPSLSLSFL